MNDMRGEGGGGGGVPVEGVAEATVMGAKYWNGTETGAWYPPIDTPNETNTTSCKALGRVGG